MPDHQQAERMIQIITDWAKTQPVLRALALVGSHARGTERADSDIDFVALTTAPESFRNDAVWLEGIDWNALGARPVKWQDEDYGRLWSRRIWLEGNAAEVEIGFALPSWASIDPLDSGTRRVIADGCRILYDPDKILDTLCTAIKAE